MGFDPRILIAYSILAAGIFEGVRGLEYAGWNTHCQLSCKSEMWYNYRTLLSKDW